MYSKIFYYKALIKLKINKSLKAKVKKMRKNVADVNLVYCNDAGFVVTVVTFVCRCSFLRDKNILKLRQKSF